MGIEGSCRHSVECGTPGRAAIGVGPTRSLLAVVLILSMAQGCVSRCYSSGIFLALQDPDFIAPSSNVKVSATLLESKVTLNWKLGKDLPLKSATCASSGTLARAAAAAAAAAAASYSLAFAPFLSTPRLPAPLPPAAPPAAAAAAGGAGEGDLASPAGAP